MRQGGMDKIKPKTEEDAGDHTHHDGQGNQLHRAPHRTGRAEHEHQRARGIIGAECVNLYGLVTTGGKSWPPAYQ